MPGLDDIYKLQQEEAAKNQNGVTPALAEQGYVKGFDAVNTLGGISNSSEQKGSLGDTRYFEEGRVFLNDNLDRARADNQTWYQKWGNAAIKTAVGIPLGVGEIAGHMLDLENVASMFTGSNNNYDNWFSEWMRESRASLDEALPVFEREQGKAWAPGDAGWWANNIGGLVESMTEFYLVNAATAGLAGGVGGVFTGGTAIGRAAILAKNARLERGMAALSPEKMLKAQAAIERNKGMLNIFNKAAQAGSAFETGVGVSAMNAVGTYDEVYRTAAKSINPKTGQLYTEEEAKQIASESAATSFNTNLVFNSVLNYTSITPFFRGKVPPKNAKITKAAGESTDDYLTRLQQVRSNPDQLKEANKWYEKWYIDIASEMGQEALEEYGEAFAGKLGVAQGMEKVTGEKQEIDMFSEDMLVAAGLGMLGGALGKGYKAFFNRGKDNQEQEALTKELDYRIQHLETYKTAQANLAKAKAENNEAGIVEAEGTLFTNQLFDSLVNGTEDLFIQQMEDIANMSVEDAKNKGFHVDEVDNAMQASSQDYRSKAKASIELIKKGKAIATAVQMDGYLQDELKPHVMREQINAAFNEHIADGLRKDIALLENQETKYDAAGNLVPQPWVFMGNLQAKLDALESLIENEEKRLTKINKRIEQTTQAEPKQQKEMTAEEKAADERMNKYLDEKLGRTGSSQATTKVETIKSGKQASTSTLDQYKNQRDAIKSQLDEYAEQERLAGRSFDSKSARLGLNYLNLTRKYRELAAIDATSENARVKLAKLMTLENQKKTVEYLKAKERRLPKKVELQTKLKTLLGNFFTLPADADPQSKQEIINQLKSMVNSGEFEALDLVDPNEDNALSEYDTMQEVFAEVMNSFQSPEDLRQFIDPLDIGSEQITYDENGLPSTTKVDDGTVQRTKVVYDENGNPKTETVTGTDTNGNPYTYQKPVTENIGSKTTLADLFGRMKGLTGEYVENMSSAEKAEMYAAFGKTGLGAFIDAMEATFDNDKKQTIAENKAAVNLRLQEMSLKKYEEADKIFDENIDKYLKELDIEGDFIPSHRVAEIQEKYNKLAAKLKAQGLQSGSPEIYERVIDKLFDTLSSMLPEYDARYNELTLQQIVDGYDGVLDDMVVPVVFSSEYIEKAKLGNLLGYRDGGTYVKQEAVSHGERQIKGTIESINGKIVFIPASAADLDDKFDYAIELNEKGLNTPIQEIGMSVILQETFDIGLAASVDGSAALITFAGKAFKLSEIDPNKDFVYEGDDVVSVYLQDDNGVGHIITDPAMITDLINIFGTYNMLFQEYAEKNFKVTVRNVFGKEVVYTVTDFNSVNPIESKVTTDSGVTISQEALRSKGGALTTKGRVLQKLKEKFIQDVITKLTDEVYKSETVESAQNEGNKEGEQGDESQSNNQSPKDVRESKERVRRKEFTESQIDKIKQYKYRYEDQVRQLIDSKNVEGLKEARQKFEKIANYAGDSDEVIAHRESAKAMLKYIDNGLKVIDKSMEQLGTEAVNNADTVKSDKLNKTPGFEATKVGAALYHNPEGEAVDATPARLTDDFKLITEGLKIKSSSELESPKQNDMVVVYNDGYHYIANYDNGKWNTSMVISDDGSVAYTNKGSDKATFVKPDGTKGEWEKSKLDSNFEKTIKTDGIIAYDIDRDDAGKIYRKIKDKLEGKPAEDKEKLTQEIKQDLQVQGTRKESSAVFTTPNVNKTWTPPGRKPTALIKIDSAGYPLLANAMEINDEFITQQGLDMLNNPTISAKTHTVNLKIIENSWWNSQPEETKKKRAEYIPIYVELIDRVTGEAVIVGRLMSVNKQGQGLAERTAIVNALDKGEKVGANISTEQVRYFSMTGNTGVSHVNNVYNDKGEPIFYSILDPRNGLVNVWHNTADGFSNTRKASEVVLVTTEGIPQDKAFSSDTNLKLSTKGSFENVDKKLATIYKNTLGNIKIDNNTEGQIFMPMVRPDGQMTAIPMSTANVPSQVIEQFLLNPLRKLNPNGMTEAEFDKFADGLRQVLAIDSKPTKDHGKFFMVDKVLKNGKFVGANIKFWSKKHNAYLTVGLSNREGASGLITAMANNQPIKATVTTVDKSNGNFIGSKNVIDITLNDILDALKDKKFNIQRDLLNSTRKYTITNPTTGISQTFNSYNEFIMGAKDVDGNDNFINTGSHPAIVSHNLMNVNGSIFNSTGITLTDLSVTVTKVKKAAEKKETKPTESKRPADAKIPTTLKAQGKSKAEVLKLVKNTIIPASQRIIVVGDKSKKSNIDALDILVSVFGINKDIHTKLINNLGNPNVQPTLTNAVSVKDHVVTINTDVTLDKEQTLRIKRQAYKAGLTIIWNGETITDIDANEKHYVDIESGKKYKRVTTTFKDTPEDSALLDSANTIGTKVDTLIRDFFTPKRDGSYWATNPDGTLFSKEQFTELVNNEKMFRDKFPTDDIDSMYEFMKELQKIKASMNARGEVPFANDILLHNDEMGVAGTVDLLTVDNDGVVRIYDFKTMKGNQLVDKYAGESEVKYDSGYKGKMSNREAHQKQLSMYRILLANTYGIVADDLAILPIAVDYNAGDTKSKSIQRVVNPESGKGWIVHTPLDTVGDYSITYPAGYNAVAEEVKTETKIEQKKEETKPVETKEKIPTGDSEPIIEVDTNALNLNTAPVTADDLLSGIGFTSEVKPETKPESLRPRSTPKLQLSDLKIGDQIEIIGSTGFSEGFMEVFEVNDKIVRFKKGKGTINIPTSDVVERLNRKEGISDTRYVLNPTTSTEESSKPIELDQNLFGADQEDIDFDAENNEDADDFGGDATADDLNLVGKKSSESASLNEKYEKWRGEWYVHKGVRYIVQYITDTHLVLNDEIRIPLSDVDPNQFEEIPFRRSNSTEAVIDTKKAGKWLRSRGIPFDEAKQIIHVAQNANNAKVHGYFHNGLVYLNSAAEVGTEFHEAFHAVFRIWNTEAQQRQLLDEAKRIYPAPTAEDLKDLKELYPSLNDSQIEDLYYEEVLAEKFRQYVITKQKPRTISESIWKFIKDVLNYLKTYISNKRTIDQLFSNIESGMINKQFTRVSSKDPKMFSRDKQGFNNATRDHIVNAITSSFVQKYDALKTKGESTKASEIFKSIKQDFAMAAVETLAPITHPEHSGYSAFEGAVNKLGYTVNEVKTQFASIQANILKDIQNKGKYDSSSVFDAPGVDTVIGELFKSFVKSNRSALPTTTFSEKTTGLPISNESFEKAQQAFESGKMTADEFNKIKAARKGVQDAIVYLTVNNGWYSTNRDKDGLLLPEPGWIELASHQLTEFGLRVKGTQTMEEIEEGEDKIYGKDSVEEDRADMLSGKLKNFLARTPVPGAEKVLGIVPYAKRQEVTSRLQTLLTETGGVSSMDHMIRLLKDASSKDPLMQSVYNRILGLVNSNKMTDKLLLNEIYTLGAMTYRNFHAFQVAKSKDKNGFKLEFKNFDANSQRLTRKLVNDWMNNSYRPGGIYRVDENGDVIVNKANLNRLENLIGMIKDPFGKPYTKADIANLSEAFSILGVDMPIDAIEKAMKTGITTGKYTLKNNDVFDFLLKDKSSSYKGTGRGFKEVISALKEGKNMHITDISFFKKAALIRATAGGINNMSFIDPHGKNIFPVNMHASFTRAMSALSFYDMGNDTMDAWVDELANDPKISYKTKGFDAISPLYALKGNPENLVVTTFSAYKETGDNIGNKDFESLTEVDELLYRLNAYANSGDKNHMWVIAPTLGDRGSSMMLKVPRITSNTMGNGYGVKTTADVFRGMIIQDIKSMQQTYAQIQANTKDGVLDTTDLLMYYHYNVDKKGNITPGNWKKFSQLQFLNNTAAGKKLIELFATTDDEQYLTDIRKADGLIEAALKEVNSYIEAKTQNMLTKLDQLKIHKFHMMTDKKSGKNIILDIQNPLDLSMYDNDSNNMRVFIKDFITADIIMKNEVKKFSGGDQLQFKGGSVEAFSKRMGAEMTPGTESAIQGDKITEGVYVEYGDVAEYSMAIMDDIFAEDDSYEFMKTLIDLPGVNSAAIKARIESTFAKNKSNKADAMGYTTIHKHRAKLLGTRGWTPVHEEAYQNYLKGGEFAVYNEFGEVVSRPVLNPLKTFHNGIYMHNGKAVRVMVKHSTFPLLREFTKNSPKFDNLRMRMEAEGPYSDLEPIDETNHISAVKTGIYNSNKVNNKSVEQKPANFYEGDIKPEPNTIFVFGSNPLGINGNPAKNTGGAALVALQQFGVKQGEKMDNRLSDSGNAYGLVTVTAPGKKKSLTPEQITDNIKKLYEIAKANPNKQFKIAYRNTDKASLNGYTGLEMIDMFNAAGVIPDNVVFSKEWVDTGKLTTVVTKEQPLEEMFRSFKTLPFKLQTRNQRIPQVIPDRVKVNKLGSQTMKLAPAGLSEFAESDYNIGGKKVKGKDVFKKYQKVLTQMQQNELNKLYDRLGYDSNGLTSPEQQLKFLNNLRRILRTVVEERGLSNNYLKTLNIVPDGKGGYEFEVPMASPMFMHKFEQMMVSLFKNGPLNLTINGKAFVQIAEFGTHVKDGSLKFLHADENGGVAAAEVAIPWEMAEKMGLPKDENGDYDLSQIDQKLLTMVGYRIPTQGKSAMLPMKIVRIIPKGMGKVIMVPGEITAQMGSDFDVDKLYTMMPNYTTKYDKAYKEYDRTNEFGHHLMSKLKHENKKVFFDTFTPSVLEELWNNPEMVDDYLMDFQSDLTAEEIIDAVEKAKEDTLDDMKAMGISDKPKAVYIPYDLDKVENNNQAQLENMFLDLTYGILSSPNHLEDVLSPVDSDTAGNLKKIAAFRITNETSFLNKLDANDPMTDIILAMRNKVGKAGIGMYAVNMTGAAVAEYTETELAGDFAIKTMTGEYTKLNRAKDDNGVSLIYSFSKHLTMAVDNANDPIMAFLNDNMETAGVTSLFIRSGVVVPGLADRLALEILKTDLEEFASKADKEWSDIAKNAITLLNDSNPVNVEMALDMVQGFGELNEVAFPQLKTPEELDFDGGPVEVATVLRLQPIVLKLTQEMQNNNYSEVEDGVAELLIKYGGDIKGEGRDQFVAAKEKAKELTGKSTAQLDFVKMVDNIGKDLDMTDPEQLKILNTYAAYVRAAREMMNINKVYFNSDVLRNRMSNVSKLLEVNDIKNNLNSREKPVIKGWQSIMDPNLDTNPYPISKSFSDTLDTMKNFIGNFMPHGTEDFGIIAARLKSDTGADKLSEKIYDQYAKFVMPYLLSLPNSPVAQYFTPEYQAKLMYKGYDDNENIVAQLNTIKNMILSNTLPDLKDNRFLDMLDEHPDNRKPKVKVLGLKFETAAKLTSFQQDDIIEDFNVLFNHENKVVRKFANALLAYNIAAKGLRSGVDSFADLIPIDVMNIPMKSGESINGYIRRMTKGSLYENLGGLSEAFIENNFHIDGLVKPFDKKLISEFQEEDDDMYEITPEADVTKLAKYTYDYMNGNKRLLKLVTINGTSYYTPYEISVGIDGKAVHYRDVPIQKGVPYKMLELSKDIDAMAQIKRDLDEYNDGYDSCPF